MNLFKKKQSKKQTLSSNVEKQIKSQKRVQQQANPTVQDSIFYTSQFEEGLMHIVEDEFSKCYKLGEVDYEIAVEEDQLNTVMGYAEGLNTLDKNSRYQLLVVNKREEESLMEDVLLAYQEITQITTVKKLMKLLRSSMNKTSETLRLKNMLFSPQKVRP